MKLFFLAVIVVTLCNLSHAELIIPTIWPQVSRPLCLLRTFCPLFRPLALTNCPCLFQ